MKYLSSFGCIWRLSDRAYRRFLRNAAAGREWDLDNYGKRVAHDAITVTDLTAEQAQEILKGEDPRYVIPSREEEDKA